MKSNIENKNKSKRLTRALTFVIDKVWLLLAATIIFSAILHIILGLLLPKIDRYQDEIIQWVEEKYDINIEVEKISAKWSTQGPVIALSDFKIKSKNGEYNIVEIGELSLYVNIIHSVWNRRFSTQEILIDKANLRFYLDRKLGIRLDTRLIVEDTTDVVNDNQSIETISQDLIDTLFAQKKILLTDSSLKLFTLRGTEFQYHVNQLKVEKFENVHQLSGELEYTDAGKIKLITELHGDPSNEKSYSNVYLQGSNIDIAKIPWLDSFPVRRPSEGELSWRLWGTWSDKHWKKVDSQIEVNNLFWSNDHLANTQTNHFSTLTSWQHQKKQSGYLAFHQVKVDTVSADSTIAETLIAESETDETKTGKIETAEIVTADTDTMNANTMGIGEKIKEAFKDKTASKNIKLKDNSLKSSLYARYKNTSSNDLNWSAFIDGLAIEPLTDYLAVVIDNNSQYADFLKHADFKLTLEELKFNVNKYNDVWQSPLTIIGFSGLSYRPWNNIPRANGLAGKLQFTSYFGHGKLWANDTELNLPDVFRDPIKINQLSSDLVWAFTEENQLSLNLNSLGLSNKDLTLQAKLKYFHQDNVPSLSLYTEIHDLNGSNKSLYLPVGVMSDNLVSYLDESIKSGSLPLIKTVVRGALNEFPYANPNGLFVVFGKTKNTNYKFLKDWPIVKNLDAKLLFQGNRMEITTGQAESHGNQIDFLKATIDDLSLPTPILKLSLKVDSQNNSARDFIAKSSIKTIASALKRINYQGDLTSSIELQIALSENSKAKLNGKVEFSPENSSIKNAIFNIDHIKGAIKFNEEGISNSNLQANFYGETLDINLIGDNKANSPVLTINIDGKLPAEGLNALVPNQVEPYFDGKTTFSSVIQFNSFDKPSITNVLFQSNLSGLAFNLPNILGKTKKQKTEMFISLELAKHSVGEIKWKNIEGYWYWDDIENTKKLQRNTPAINYGGNFFINKESVYQENLETGLNIDGLLNKSDLTSWLSFIKNINSSNETEGDSELVFNRIDLDIKDLSTPLFNLKDSQLHIEKKYDQAWFLQLKNTKGDFSLRMPQNQAWEFAIKDVNLDFKTTLFSDDKKDTQTETKRAKLINGSPEKSIKVLPQDFIDIDVLCQRCIFQSVNYGNFSIQLRHKKDQLNFSAISSKKKQHHVALSGVWKNDSGNIQSTSIQYNLHSSNVGKLLRKWDVDVGVEDSSGNLISELSWSGAPWDFDYTLASGTAQLKLGKGYLSEISDEKGRIFSLFNLQSLVRKLTFDFKDVYKKGFFYDSIRGSFKLDKGIISTENLKIKGNVADVKVFGSTNLKNESIEQYAVITPHLTSSLPVLAAWAVEPTTGIIVYLLNKIMEPAIEVATQINYRVHGSFDDVKVEEINTSKKKFKVEYEAEEKMEDNSNISNKNITGSTTKK